MRWSPIPTILVCDEPTGDLDRKAADEVLHLLQTLNRDFGKSIIMVTHDPKAAEFAGPRAAHGQGRARGSRMKFLPLIWATLWRKKTRTIFTLLSIVVAFLLYGVLETVDYAFAHPSTGVSGASLLITINKYSITLQLPFADEQEIRSVPGVTEVTWLTWFGAYYQEPKNFVFALPIDTDSYFHLHEGDFVYSDADLLAFRNSRDGAMVNAALMKKYGWKVGDRIPLHSTIWTQKNASLDWNLLIVGTFDAKDPSQAGQQASTLLFHYELFDEGRSFGKGRVGWFEERVEDPAAVGSGLERGSTRCSRTPRTRPKPSRPRTSRSRSSNSSATSASFCARFSERCSSRCCS